MTNRWLSACVVSSSCSPPYPNDGVSDSHNGLAAWRTWVHLQREGVAPPPKPPMGSCLRLIMCRRYRCGLGHTRRPTIGATSRSRLSILGSRRSQLVGEFMPGEGGCTLFCFTSMTSRYTPLEITITLN